MTDFSDRFWSKVAIAGNDECWLWTGSHQTSGYGDFRRDGKHWTAHRYSMSLVEDLVPGLFVLHSCDNPGCVNSAHLRQGTPADNNADMAARKRSLHGERNPFVKLTADAVREIRRRLTNGETQYAIADELGLHRNTIHYLAVRKTWKHV